MKIVFKINYRTYPGKDVYITGSLPELGKWQTENAVRMHCTNGEDWIADIELQHSETADFEYYYFISGNDLRNILPEEGHKRKLLIHDKKFDILEIDDLWQTQSDFNKKNLLFKTAFKNVIFARRDKASIKGSIKSGSSPFKVSFQVKVPKLDPEHEVCLLGDKTEIGEWDIEKPQKMHYTGSSVWETSVDFDSIDKTVFYKYGIFSKKEKKVIELETDKNRAVTVPKLNKTKISALRIDGCFRYHDFEWHGAGAAIPVFSLRSKNGMGVGEFPDLKLLVDWCVRTGIRMIQILPVNDTIHTHSWADSYPYSGISVFALHPIYLNIQKMLPSSSKIQMEKIEKDIEKLNNEKVLDYERVIKIKSRYFKEIYHDTKNTFLESSEFKTFFQNNKHWLIPYAAFCHLRDYYGTYNYNKWEVYSTFNETLIKKLVDPGNDYYDDIAIHYFIQFHLHKQLMEAADYARKNRIVLKGDIPIGINRYSIETWTKPELFHLDGQAGAPPDDFSVDGQNWGFPTYNWEKMQENGFQWWRDRLKQLSKYFDAFRIDHILGFFRIWEVPSHAVTGLLGYFRPALPFHISELESLNIGFNRERFCKPYITEKNLISKYGKKEAEHLINNYLNEYKKGFYELRPEYDTQKKVKEKFKISAGSDKYTESENEKIKKQLYSLLSEVLFIEDKDEKDCFHPRITIHKTDSYNDLDNFAKEQVYSLYIEYYYNRQEKLWEEQAMIKLPALLRATDMLICGEDLGMIPECVPRVINKLGILSLRIQRMPKEEWLDFGIPKEYPYMAVCATSCHDMSTLRGWWEEDGSVRQKFFNNILNRQGEAPPFCEPWICDEIIMQHLHSPCMWAVFPVQDLIATNTKIRRKFPDEEKINDPSNPDNRWEYRLHLPLEVLIEEEELNNHLRTMLVNSGR
ncbi:MAG: 4-alpha-glucanotransferase [Victivallales bacterium]|nr:4-alpha-glucanotransferase [Victivallales bacterium]MCF7888790.1 4-alpha-glucanotransferase [Victivallales bacterium]